MLLGWAEDGGLCVEGFSDRAKELGRHRHHFFVRLVVDQLDDLAADHHGVGRAADGACGFRVADAEADADRDARIRQPADRLQAQRLHRVGVLGRPESRLGSDGWLFAGPHDYSAEPVYNITGRLIFPVRFWFGCYETQGRYDFDIRASATDPSSYVYGYRGHRLDISRGGYLGLYGCSDPVGVDPLGAGMMIWRLEGLEAGALETPKPGDAVFANHVVHMTATPQQSLEAAANAARAMGLNAYILSDEIEGESREVAKVHAALARAAAKGLGPFTKPCVILSGGETTVTIKQQPAGTPKGRGGRAGEFCMGLAEALQGQSGVWALAADTDGIDGIEDNAGAQVTPDTLSRAAALDQKVDDHLQRNDAYGFFEPLGDLVITGPTHTNVNDFRAILVR